MRPINLIPDEERRRGTGAVTRTGPAAYLLVGALGVLLIGVVMLVLFNNSINDRKGEVARLETEKEAATAQATKLAPYINFKQVSEDRTQTVAELADSRFDWVRVIRQLSLVLPGDVYFESFAASGGGGQSGIAGPSLSIAGCAASQPAVANFVASLKEIAGITRVELNNSTLNGEVEGSSKGGSPCSRAGVAKFEVLAAFDAAPPSPDSPGSTVGEASESEEAESSEEGSEEESSEGESAESESSESSESSSSQSASATTAGAAG